MYPNEKNMITVPITERMKIVMSIQVCLISWMNIDYGKWLKETDFLQIQSINIMYRNEENVIVVPIRKRIEIITSIYVWLISTDEH